MVNYYHVLGLTEDASPQEIKAAFKRLAVKFHPDKHPNRPEMEEKFKEINQAHQVLSDPYEKARFDLKLKYQQFSNAPEYTYAGNPYRKKGYRHPPRPFYTSPPRMDSRQNIIATAYAFGITFLIAALVMGGVWIKQSIEEKRYKAYLAERRTTYEEAKLEFEAGNYFKAYNAMLQFDFFRVEERDMREFRDTMVDQIIEKGHQELENKKFQAAIALYNLAFELKPSLPYLGVRKRLVEAYKQSGEIDKAIAILEEFLASDFDIIASLVNLAGIHRDYLDDPAEAMEKFQLAHRLAVKRYKKIYGDGYPILIREEHLPISHYDLYSGLADMYLKIGDPQMAIKAANWNKYVWPDSIDAFTTSGFAYLELGNQVSACDQFEHATNRGWKEPAPVNCN